MSAGSATRATSSRSSTGELSREARGTIIVAESITFARALEALEGQRKQAIALNIRGRLPDGGLDAELDRVAAEKAALEPLGAQDVPEADIDVLAEVRARLDARLTDQHRQEIVRLLVRIVVNTTTNDDGQKSVRVLVTYRFPPARTGIREGLNYTVARRIIELPPSRYRVKAGVA